MSFDRKFDQTQISRQLATTILSIGLLGTPLISFPEHSIAASTTAVKSKVSVAPAAPAAAKAPAKSEAKAPVPSIIDLEISKELKKLNIVNSPNLSADEKAVITLVTDKVTTLSKSSNLASDLSSVKSKLLSNKQTLKESSSQLSKLDAKLKVKDLQKDLREIANADAVDLRKDVAKVR